MFAKIRGSLAVRSLTKEELVAVFQTITTKLEAGETAYLGVLIRLLTGLESNIVCALKWGDFEEIADYGIYRLVVAHQVTNDGETVRGFDTWRITGSYPAVNSWLPICYSKSGQRRSRWPRITAEAYVTSPL